MAVLAQLARDLRQAARAFRRAPVVAAVVVGSLALGIGANATVFSWVQARILEPIGGVRGGARFHFIEPRGEGGSYPGTSWREYLDVRDRVVEMDRVIGFRLSPLTTGGTDGPSRVTAMLVSDNYFDALRLAPARGRLFSTRTAGGDDTTPDLAAVVSHRYWQSRLGAADDVVGHVLQLNAQPLVIVGVAPRHFQGTAMGLQADVWVPATLAPRLFDGSTELDDRGQRAYTVLGALRPGATRPAAQADLDRIMRDLTREAPATNAGITADVLPYWQSPRGPQRFLSAALTVLQAAMLLVLAAVCANAATLLLARASARRQEVAVRLAIGAARWRVMSLLLTESLLFAATGTALGALLAVWGTSAFRAVPLPAPNGMTVELFTAVDWTTIWFAAALGVAAAFIVGILPALQLARLPPQAVLRDGRAAGGRAHARDAIMVVQVALAALVLVIAAVFVRQLDDARTTDPGFDRDGVLLAAYDLRGRVRAVEPAAATTFANRLLTQIAALPSVDRAALAISVPLDIHGFPGRQYQLEGSARADGMLDRALTNIVSAGYFATMGIAMVDGSDFAALSDPAAPMQAIVNDTFARQHGPRPVIGRTLTTAGRSYRIVGVVADSRYNAYDEPATPFIYLSLRDRPSPSAELHVRRRAGTDAALANEVRRIVRDLDPALPLYNVRSLDDHVEANLVFRRIPARLFGVLGPVLLGVIGMGIYAVVSYTITRRRTEVGVRMALGGTPQRVTREFVADTLQMVGLGLAAGLLFAWIIVSGMAGTASGLLLPVIGVAAMIGGVAFAASWVPVRRAARVDPHRILFR